MIQSCRTTEPSLPTFRPEGYDLQITSLHRQSPSTMSFTRRRPTGLTILPPSPTTNTTSSDRSQPPPQLQPLQTQLLSPTSASPHPLSPRGSPLPPSPAISHHSYSTFSGVPAIPVAGGAGRRGSVGTARSDVSSAAGSASTSGVGSRDKDRDRDRGPVPPVKVDKRLPGLPGSPGAGAQGQPQRKGTGTGGGQVDAGAGKGGWAGAYDNRLVSATLSTSSALCFWKHSCILYCVT